MRFLTNLLQLKILKATRICPYIKDITIIYSFSNSSIRQTTEILLDAGNIEERWTIYMIKRTY